MTSLVVLHASQLVTLRGPKRPRVGQALGEVGIIRDGGMLVRDGKIEFVGPSDEIEGNLTALSSQVSARGEAPEIVDASGRVVMPGFVDAHTHLVFAGVTTEVCVQTTMREANDRGFDCLLAEDATESYFPEFKKAAVEMIRAQGAIVGWTATVDQIAKALK